MPNRSLDPNASSTFGNSLSLRVDGAIGAMSLSPNGRDAVLAGRRGLFIIDLDDPFTPPRWLHHITSWEVADVQWSPHHFAKPSWCISTSNQKALLWDLKRPSSNAIANILHSHTRAISDINFHPFDPEILATCAIDTFIMSWDMRTPRKPVAKWSEWRAGAIQVKWNHENPYEIASSHDNAFYIWDTRKGALPVVKIENAHDKKINGLDFNQGLKNIVTCSNDGTVKFWNLKSDEATKFISDFDYFGAKSDRYFQPSVIIETDFPIARARNLPFGSDKACGIMPLKGGENAIHIVNYDDVFRDYLNTNETQRLSFNPIHSFKGHRGAMKDFLWRTKHENYEGFESKKMWKDYQLVTWSSEDYDLKLWPHDPNLYKGVNYDPTFVNVFQNESDSEVSRPHTPPTAQYYNYDTFCKEPEITIDDITKVNGGDILSAMTLSLIADKHKRSSDEFMQLNHLNWISGVRMGHAGREDRNNSETTLEDDGPSNLGEEVSIVGHKFPKIRFEKISVSTGELIISLKGPLPSLDNPDTDKGDSLELNEANLTESVISAREKSIASETEKETEKISHKDLSIRQETASDPLKDDPSGEQKLIFIRLEVDFPDAYPYLEYLDSDKNLSAKKLARFQKQNLIKFKVEETHELSKQVKLAMQKNLDEIAQFYTNKFQRFCLEPCLRYLMGEKVDLDEEMMIESRRGSNDNDGEEFIQEAIDEAWVDDLINQQPDIPTYSSGEEEDGEEDSTRYHDLIPAISNHTAYKTPDGTSQNQFLGNLDPIIENLRNVDSTPLPSGCGAIWSPTGQLVCFFIPKSKSSTNVDVSYEEDDTNKGLQKFNVFKFTDGDAEQKSHNHSHHHRFNSIESDSELVNADNSDGSGNHDDDDEVRSTCSSFSGTSLSSSSDGSFANDWDEMLSNDAPRGRVPGLFKTSLGLGNRFRDHDSSHKSSLNRFISNGGSASNQKSSMKGDYRKKIGEDANKKNKNIVGIFDFAHLLPDKYDLAREYRVLGDSPEVLANHNAKVALKYGLKEISDVWKILEMLLMKNIHHPTDIIPGHVPNFFGNDKLKSDFGNQLMNMSHFYWNEHPFGSSWFVQEIFNYFEKKQNIQMLAMMSCIMYENPVNLKLASESMYVPVHTPYQALPQPPTLLDTARNSSIFGLMHPPSSAEDQKFDQRNSSFSSTRKDSSLSALAATSYAKSIGSSLDAESVINGSPDKFKFLKRNLPSRGGYPAGDPTNNSLSSLGEVSFNDSNFSTMEKNARILQEKRNKNITKRPYSTKKIRTKPVPVVTIEMQNVQELDLYENLNSQALLSSIPKDKLRWILQHWIFTNVELD
ncbi:hypothetical protein G210_0364, partial [Candida maltosa Xu316]